MQQFSYKKMKMLFAKLQLFCLGLNVLSAKSHTTTYIHALVYLVFSIADVK